MVNFDWKIFRPILGKILERISFGGGAVLTALGLGGNSVVILAFTVIWFIFFQVAARIVKNLDSEEAGKSGDNRKSRLKFKASRYNQKKGERRYERV